MALSQIVPGTKETARVTLDDLSDLVSDLSGSGPTFTVKNEAGTNMVTDVAATASGLVISCLVDTTVGGTWAEGEYRLFVKFTVGSEVVIKGPHYFLVSFT